MGAPGSGADPGRDAASRAAGRDVHELQVDGLRVLLQRNRAHEVVAVRLYVRGGACNLDAARAGAELLYARAARRGTRRHPKPELNAALARLGIDLAAAAANDCTVFDLRCVKRHLDPAWDLFADVILDPLLEPAEIDVVRQQMQLDFRQRLDTPDGALGDLARRHCYAGHAYAPDPYGTEASLPGLDATLLRAHAARYLTRANCLLVVAGDLAPEEVARLAAVFGRLPPGDTPSPLPPPLCFVRSTLVVEPRALPTNYVLGEFGAPALRDPDHPAMLVALAVLRDRFFEEVRTKRNLSYAPSAGLGRDAANLGSIYVTAADPRATLQVMRAEMRRLMDEPLSPKELADKIRTFVTRYHLQNETNHAQAGFLAAYELFGGGWARGREFVARLEALHPEDLRDAARRCLRHIQYFYLGDPARADPEVLADP